jgi:hypothetical protein
VLHLGWWHSFVFYDEDDDMKEQTYDMGLKNQLGGGESILSRSNLLVDVTFLGTHINLVFCLNFFLN